MKHLILLLFLSATVAMQAQGFKEKEVKRSVTGGTLYGTLLKAKDANGVAVVFISGSGPTDRDGNSGIGGENNSLKMLAQALGQKGYTSLRVDKRGIGKSYPGYPEKDTRLETYIDDITEWINWLKANNKDIKKVVIAGHSEGSLIGMLAAQKTNAAGFISLAGAGFKADSILKQQLEAQLPVKMYAEAEPALDSLADGFIVQNPPKALAMLFRPSVMPYLISWFKYDPAAEIGKLTCPVLIMQGLDDIQVGKEHAEALAKGQPAAQLLLLDKVTHVLKEAGPTQAENMATYSNPTLPLSSQLVDAVVLFLDKLK